MALIKCENVSIGYEGQMVVHDLNFEINQGDYLCIVGENGSGKSTIAKAVKKIISGGNLHITQAEMKDIHGNAIILTDDEKARVFVFDEEFVDENVKLQEDGLNTIVMLGQQADLANQISQAQTELNIAKQELEAQKTIVLNEFENQSNSAS